MCSGKVKVERVSWPDASLCQKAIASAHKRLPSVAPYAHFPQLSQPGSGLAPPESQVAAAGARAVAREARGAARAFRVAAVCGGGERAAMCGGGVGEALPRRVAGGLGPDILEGSAFGALGEENPRNPCKFAGFSKWG